MSPEVINGEGYGRKADVWYVNMNILVDFWTYLKSFIYRCRIVKISYHSTSHIVIYWIILCISSEAV